MVAVNKNIKNNKEQWVKKKYAAWQIIQDVTIKKLLLT